VEESRTLSYTETTQGIRITVFPQFISSESSPIDGIYVFAYMVAIENNTEGTVQLLRRHWVVSSGTAVYTEVRGDGVVGEQPVLEPGEAFQYSSGCVIKDPFGSMHGSYTFQNGAKHQFEVEIPRFDLICPHLIHWARLNGTVVNLCGYVGAVATFFFTLS
jgi:ApaG protein